VIYRSFTVLTGDVIVLWNWIQRHILRLVFLVTVLIILMFGSEMSTPSPAIAAIRQLEEVPGQVVYQSRRTLTDQTGHNWQAIAFKRIYPDGKSLVYLRLVGFPGTTAIDHSEPLMLISSIGQILPATDASSQIFNDSSFPAPNVGQYDIKPVLPQMQPELSWRLSLPTTNDISLTLQVPSALVQEWQTLTDL
jgi:hypothetical protein